jgi:hypothetical protein
MKVDVVEILYQSLTQVQHGIIAMDYAMHNGSLRFIQRLALTHYALVQMQVLYDGRFCQHPDQVMHRDLLIEHSENSSRQQNCSKN